MQTTVMIETASGSYYHNDRGNLQKDNSSNPKKEDLLLSSNGCNEVRVTFPNVEYDSLTLQQRASHNEIRNIDEAELSEPSFSANRDTNVANALSQSSEFEDSIEYDFLNETYSIPYSESKLKADIIHLRSELETKMQDKEETLDILELQGNNTVGFERTHKISDASFEETAEDAAKNDVEDSQYEYHSAEQDYISKHLSFDQTKTLSISNLHGGESSSSGYEDKWVDTLEDDRVRLESSSTASLYSLNEFTSAQGHSPPISKFQNSAMLKEYEPTHEKCKEQETGLMYHAVFDNIVQRSSSFLNPQKPLKTKIVTEKEKLQTIANKDFCGTRIVEDKILQHLEHSSISLQDKASETLPHISKDGQTSGTSMLDDSLISACSNSQYESLQSTPNPRTSAIQNQTLTEDSCLQVVSSSATNKTCPQAVMDAASCAITVSQTLDVSTDFRASFTTSKAKSSVVSTSSNTEITMMDRKWPHEWPEERQRSVACNTDWALLQDGVDTVMAVTKASVESLKPNKVLINKDSLEVRKIFDTTDLKKHSEREFQFSEETKKNLVSECCQKTMHRAIKAEMHLLNVYYQTCQRHCCRIYKLMTESRTELNRNLPSDFSKKELGLALLSVRGDLRARYMDLKERIHKGIPLEELPPLSVESKILSAFSAFVSRLMKEDSIIFSGADSELENRGVSDIDICPGLKETLSQISLLPDNSHPEQDRPPKEDGFQNNDLNVYFSQLELYDEVCRNHSEVSEDWFDATENLTGGDVSGRKESQTEQDTWNLNFPLEKKHVELFRGDKGFLIHVGGLCPSVSKTDLRSHFQKYQVSEISIYDSSNYRYASLAFTKHSDAKRAVKEMNGTEINGKSVNVRLVKTPGEHSSNRVGLNHLEKSNKEVSPASSVSRLPKTRPRQLESEHDNELSHMDQKGIKKNCKQIESPRLLPETSVHLIPPDTLNLSSFTKIMKRLTELHPEVSRHRIIDALQEVRTNHKGFLNGLSIGTIVEMTSSFLKNAVSR